MMDIEVAQSTNMGRVRDHNEDAIGSWIPDSRARKRSHGWLLALADGVGGHDFGEVASALAIETLIAEFPKAAPNSPLASLLPDLIRLANTRIVERAADVKGKGLSMCTTVVACALRYDQAVIAHAGDSRCYRIRPAKLPALAEIIVLTRDHTAANEQSLMAIDPELNKHILTRSLGKEMFISPDVVTSPIEPDDLLLLCSDGLHGALSDRRIAAIATQSLPLAEIARQLTDEATEADGGDNATVFLARIKKIERIGMYRGRPYRLQERQP